MKYLLAFATLLFGFNLTAAQLGQYGVIVNIPQNGDTNVYVNGAGQLSIPAGSGGGSPSSSSAEQNLGTIAGGGTLTLSTSTNLYRAALSGSTFTVNLPTPPTTTNGYWAEIAWTNTSGGTQVGSIQVATVSTALARDELAVAGVPTLVTTVTNATTGTGRLRFETVAGVWRHVDSSGDALSLSVGNALTSNPLSQFAATTSAQFLGVISDETGGTFVVGSDSPTFTGDPKVPNIVLSDSDTTIANTAFVKSNITASASLSVLKAGDTMTGTLTVTGLTNSALTASAAVVTAADKSLASVAYTGSGNVMRTRTGIFRNITIPTDGWIVNATNAATASTNAYTGTGYFSVPLYSFADLQTNRITRIFEMPETWDASTVKFKFHWSCTNTSGDVKWWVHGKVLPDNGDPATAWGTSVSVTDTAQTASRPLLSAATGAMTFGGTAAAGGLAILEVYRDAGDSGDTLAGSAELWSVDLGYTESATEPTAW